MNNQYLLHTPEGVRDIYGAEYARKETVQKRIAQVMKLYGYRNIQTPMFEFFGIFSKERGSVESRKLFKFFDREGNTLVLRPDITPSIARCAAKYYMDENMPVRLSYCGDTFINDFRYQGRLKENTQMGAELIGDQTSDADAEMLAMLIDSLIEAGLSEFQVEIGHIDFFNGLMEEAGLKEEDRKELRDLIEEKNYFGVEELLSKQDLPETLKESIIKIPQTFGTVELLKEAKKVTSNQTALAALARLEKIYQILSVYGLESYVTFDLGMLGKYDYYTGIIFKAYTYGTGDAVATGGRYDKLLIQFGKDAASIGFAVNLDALMSAMERQKMEVDTDIMGTILLYDRTQKELAIRLAGILRGQKTPIQLMKQYREKSLEDYIALAKRSDIGGIFYLDETGQCVQIINVLDGSTNQVSLDAFMKPKA